MKKIFISVFFIFITQFSFAQAKLNGNVLSKKNHAKLVKASIYVPELNLSSTSNENGEYVLNGFRKGEFKILFSYLGFKTKIIYAKFNDRDTTINIEMDEESFDMNEFVISEGLNTPSNENLQGIILIKKTELAQTGSSNIMDVLSSTPGISAMSNGPFLSRPVIRGLSGNRILTLLDGVRFETQQWDDEHSIGLNENGMDHVEIIKGPASILYGPEAMGGVINIIEDYPAEVGHLMGSFNGSVYSNNMGFLAETDVKSAYKKYNWKINILGKILPDYYWDGYRFRAPNTRMSEFSGKGSLGLIRHWGSSNLNFYFNQAYFGILDAKDIVKNSTGTISIKDSTEKDMFPSEIEAPYQSVVDKKIISKTNFNLGQSKFKISLGYQSNHRTEFEENGNKVGYNYIDMNLNSSIYDFKWYAPTWKNISIIVSLQGMYQVNENNKLAKTQLIPDARTIDNGIASIIKYSIGNFNFSAASRFDKRDLNTLSAIRDSTVNMPAVNRIYENFCWAFGATYNFNKLLLFRANMASGYRPPNLNELMSEGVKLESMHYEIGNINFLKEQNSEADLGFIFKTTLLSFEASAFINRINNFIYLVPTIDSVKSNLPGDIKLAIYRFSQADAILKGFETGLDIHPGNIRWAHLEIKASSLLGYRTNNFSYLPMMPADKVSGKLIFNFKEFKKFKDIIFSIGSTISFAQNKLANQEAKTPSYVILNLSLATNLSIWKINELTLVLAVRNALDNVYLDNMSRLRPFGIFNQGRNIVLSIKIPFDIKHNE